MWNFPPASQALILEEKLIEQKGAFLLLLSGEVVIPSEAHLGPTSALMKLGLQLFKCCCPCSAGSRSALGPRLPCSLTWRGQSCVPPVSLQRHSGPPHTNAIFKNQIKLKPRMHFSDAARNHGYVCMQMWDYIKANSIHCVWKPVPVLHSPPTPGSLGHQKPFRVSVRMIFILDLKEKKYLHSK